MPNQPKTQHRSVRVPDELWAAALQAAADNGTTISAEINQFLSRYIRRHRQ